MPELDGKTPTVDTLPDLEKSHIMQNRQIRRKRRLPEKWKFDIDDSLFAKIASDPLFMRFLAGVESKTTRFALSSEARWRFDAFESTDPELPEWKRIVLRVKPLEVDFSKSVEMWEKLDNEIRKTLREAIASLPEQEAVKFRDMDKNFYIEMDLS